MSVEHDVKKLVISDCRKAMAGAILLYAVKDICSGFITIYTANMLGRFADKVLLGDYLYGIQYFRRLLLCVCCNIIIVPLLETFAETVIFSRSLKYSCKVMERYLDKTYIAACALEKGETQYQLEENINSFYLVYSNLHIKILTIPFVLGYLIYNAGQVSVLYMAIAFTASLINMIIPRTFRHKRAVFDEEERKYEAKVRNREMELLEVPFMIVLLGLKKAWMEKRNELSQGYYRTVGKSRICWNAAESNIKRLLNKLSVICILLAGAVLVSVGEIEPGAVAAMTGYFAVFHKINEYVIFCIENLPVLTNLLARMQTIYDGQEQKSGAEIGTVSEITADQLSFSYEDNGSKEPVLDKISFAIKQNTKTAICGRNGSGKTTLEKLLCGLLHGYTGNLCLDSLEFSQVKIEEWRKHVAYAPQTPFLFQGSVKENIHLGNLKASEKQVEQVMDGLAISYLAEKEFLGEKDALSGGEMQKISIARAMLKNAPVLILDEPDNHLDEETRTWLIRFIEQASQTVIYISHSEEFLQVSDCRIELK